MTQSKLDFFEGKKVERVAVKLIGDPDVIVDKNELGETVAYLVLGKVGEVAFPADSEGNLVRRHRVEMRRIRQIPYVDGLSMLDEIDRAARAAEGIHELPFEDKNMKRGTGK